MAGGICNLAELVRFHEENGRPVRKVVIGEPRTGLLKAPGFVKPDEYFCKKTGMECVASRSHAINVFVRRETQASTIFDYETARRCPSFYLKYEPKRFKNAREAKKELNECKSVIEEFLLTNDNIPIN